MANVATFTPSPNQIIVTLEPDAIIADLKKAMKLMRGVASVKVQKPKEFDITKTAGYREAMDDVKHGRVTTYASLDDFYKEMGL
ncbi:MAG: hypothetical protein IKQ37_06570 [Bacteroidaceae bacterium]|nr:hypothetical protein [Bacteroidaceae bacterium]